MIFHITSLPCIFLLIASTILYTPGSGSQHYVRMPIPMYTREREFTPVFHLYLVPSERSTSSEMSAVQCGTTRAIVNFWGTPWFLSLSSGCSDGGTNTRSPPHCATREDFDLHSSS